jgi:hypothetical protein
VEDLKIACGGDATLHFNTQSLFELRLVEPFQDDLAVFTKYGFFHFDFSFW